ncbi:MAG: resuscitation-promoting factor RpfB [Actinomycetota bacterium]|nr:resuscitation-promoting factor RpfB [Actinomycetota bacterium]
MRTSVRGTLVGTVAVTVLAGCGAGESTLRTDPASVGKAQDGRSAASPAATGKSPTGSPSVARSSTPLPAPRTKTVVSWQRVPAATRTVEDSTLAQGSTRVRTAGSHGVKALTWQVTLVHGKVTKRTLVSQKVTTAPVTRVVLRGTKQEPAAPEPQARSNSCDQNYSGCVPIASDVDCAGGSGNGPAYVSGPVDVTGSDIYDLDRDNDGTACE